MAQTALSIIKSWFETGKFPTQAQFADVFDSFRHKSDPIEITSSFQDALDGKASEEAFSGHVADSDNPHAVDKSQVGLSSVDDTSDSAKPVSVAQQNALDLKSPLRPVTAKITLVDNDEVTGNNSASEFSQIKTTWTNVKAFLKTYFDTLYFSVSGGNIAGKINITDGEATILGKKAIQLPIGTAGIDSGLSVRTGVAGESIIQFGNNFSDYYTGAIDQSRCGSMLRLDTRNAVPVPGGHAYSAVQIQTRGAGVDYTGYKVPFQISGQAPEGALCIMESGVLYFYYGINVEGKPVKGVSAPIVIVGDRTVLSTDDIIICNSAANITVTLPAAVSGNRKITFKNINTGVVTLVVTGGGLLDDSTSYKFYQWDSASVLDNSGKYLII